MISIPIRAGALSVPGYPWGVTAGGKNRHRGFTLIELMIGLVIVVVLLGIGVPSFRSFILDQRLRATSSDLRIALMTARSEAIKRNSVVELQPSADGWGDGWIIPSPIDGDPDILNHAQSGDVTITIIPSDATPEFTPMGRAAAVNFEIDVGPESSGAVGCLQLQSDGRMVSNKGGCP